MQILSRHALWSKAVCRDARALSAILVLMLCFTSATTSCVSYESTHDARPHAMCNVCRCEGDLACVDVRVDENTPSLEWHGDKYYFCSSECRCRFQEHPETFAPHHP